MFSARSMSPLCHTQFGGGCSSLSALPHGPRASTRGIDRPTEEARLAGRVALTAGVCATINIPPRRVENRRIQMRLALSCALLASALLGLSACNKAKSPERVQENVAKAKGDAVEENTKADEKVKQVEAEAAKDRADAAVKAADKSVGAVVDSAVTQAE